MTIDYQTAKQLAGEKGLDPGRLHKALNWLETYPNDTETLDQALDGQWDVLPKGTIVMRDKTNPGRHKLDYLYQKA